MLAVPSSLIRIIRDVRPANLEGRTGGYPSKHETFSQCWFDVGPRLRRWPNIKPTLAERLVLARKGAGTRDNRDH